MNRPRYFETSFGDRIELQEHVEDALFPKSKSEEECEKGVEWDFASRVFQDKNIVDKIDIRDISEDIDRYAFVMDLMDELNLLAQDFETALDVGGAEGIHAALFRGQYAKSCDVADLRDGSSSTLSRDLKAALRKYRLFEILDGLRSRYGWEWLTRLSQDRRVKHHSRFFSYKYLNVPATKHYYRPKFKRQPTVNNFIIGDWYKTVDKTYDVILNFGCLWLFDHKKAFEKISASLNAGGIFATFAPYCWAGSPLGGAGGLLGGMFPFFEQRLTLDDTKRYYATFKPDLLKYVEPLYNCYDPHRPTIRNYIDCGLDNGLIVRGYKRIYHRQNFALISRSRFGDDVLVEDSFPGAGERPSILVDMDEVLANIRRFRDDVEFEDLLTRFVVMVFQKPF